MFLQHFRPWRNNSVATVWRHMHCLGIIQAMLLASMAGCRRTESPEAASEDVSAGDTSETAPRGLWRSLSAMAARSASAQAAADDPALIREKVQRTLADRDSRAFARACTLPVTRHSRKPHASAFAPR